MIKDTYTHNNDNFNVRENASVQDEICTKPFDYEYARAEDSDEACIDCE